MIRLALLALLLAGCSRPKPEQKLAFVSTPTKACGPSLGYQTDATAGQNLEVCVWDGKEWVVRNTVPCVWSPIGPLEQYELFTRCTQVVDANRADGWILSKVLGKVYRRANNEPLEAYVHGQACGSGEFRTVDEAKRCVEGTLKLQGEMRKP